VGKVIFWLVIVFAVLFVLRLVNVAKTRRPDNAPRSPRDETRAVMVRCVECGVFLPQADAKPSPAGPCCGDAECRQRAQRPH